ncbi:MAG: DUF192 domain-containing protein [Bryobacteraceae bacterium]
MRSRLVLFVSFLVLAVFLTGCSKEETDGIRSTHVKFPNGKTITVEIMRQSIEIMKGMMFRDSLAQDRGMLFVHPTEDNYAYWMFQTRIPLDIVWMDRDHRIVEISADTPPCTTEAAQCPKYGGTQKSAYVLEINAGQAAKNGLKVGDVLQY